MFMYLIQGRCLNSHVILLIAHVRLYIRLNKTACAVISKGSQNPIKECHDLQTYLEQV